MRTVVVLLTFALACGGVAAQESSTNSPIRIPASAARQHIDAEAVVTGKIVEIYTTDRLIRLNFDRAFPNQTLTAVIFANKTNLFPEVEKWKDKTVEIRGKIAEYRGRPEIILTHTNQVNVVEPAKGTPKQ